MSSWKNSNCFYQKIINREKGGGERRRGGEGRGSQLTLVLGTFNAKRSRLLPLNLTN